MAKKTRGPNNPRSSGTRATVRDAQASLSRQSGQKPGERRQFFGGDKGPAAEPDYGRNRHPFEGVELGIWKMKKTLKGK
jgi:hypothetical protein